MNANCAMTTISLDELNAADHQAFVAQLGNIYEHAPWVAEAAARKRPYRTLAALAEAMQDAVQVASAVQQHALIAGHPDLADKAVKMTADSRREQTAARLDRLSNEEFERFHQLNNAYRERFKFPFIICVRRHTKDSILREMERRLRNDANGEFNTTLREISRIAWLRLDQHVKGPDQLKVHGCISTHVLDTFNGRPAANVAVELRVVSDTGVRQRIAGASTNADGRTERPLIAEEPVPIGCYELSFAVGPYFASQKLALPDPAFLDIVPVCFSVAEPEGRYHVPLLMTPWSYATYRGS
jgi:2-oxo-4-hydroxy-4-carboxy-5-ureidoimidazoline decarboxylase